MSKYSERKAVVIGGSIGMGLATAELLSQGGAQVLITGRNDTNLENARRALGAQVHVVKSDVTSMNDINVLGDTVATRFGRVDAVFIYVGISELALLDQVTPESYDRQFNTNTRGAFFTAQKLAPLVRDGGSLVFTTVTPATAMATIGIYNGSKAALRQFARTFALELLPRGIRVNSVAPGFIDTPTLGIASLTPQERAVMNQLGDEVTPMKRHGTAEEVAHAALFLAFDATFTTGVEFPVDGGLSELDAPHN